MIIDIPSDQTNVDLRESTKVNSTNSYSRNISTCKVSTVLGKMSIKRAHPFATHLDASSLEVSKKLKFLKATIKHPMQSRLHLFVEKKNDKVL